MEGNAALVQETLAHATLGCSGQFGAALNNIVFHGPLKTCVAGIGIAAWSQGCFHPIVSQGLNDRLMDPTVTFLQTQIRPGMGFGHNQRVGEVGGMIDQTTSRRSAHEGPIPWGHVGGLEETETDNWCIPGIKPKDWNGGVEQQRFVHGHILTGGPGPVQQKSTWR
jgi:hypothetical protein